VARRAVWRAHGATGKTLIAERRRLRGPCVRHADVLHDPVDRADGIRKLDELRESPSVGDFAAQVGLVTCQRTGSTRTHPCRFVVAGKSSSTDCSTLKSFRFEDVSCCRDGLSSLVHDLEAAFVFGNDTSVAAQERPDCCCKCRFGNSLAFTGWFAVVIDGKTERSSRAPSERSRLQYEWVEDELLNDFSGKDSPTVTRPPAHTGVDVLFSPLAVFDDREDAQRQSLIDKITGQKETRDILNAAVSPPRRPET